MISSKFLISVAIFFTALLSACAPKHPVREEIVQAMKRYDRLIQKMNTDSIALLYTKDGNLGNVARGRDSIRSFLNKFKEYKVLSQYSTSDSIHITGNAAFQEGTYQQITITPQKDTIKVKGKYIANWTWLPEGGWHIQQMETKPIQ